MVRDWGRTVCARRVEVLAVCSGVCEHVFTRLPTYIFLINLCMPFVRESQLGSALLIGCTVRVSSL